MTTLPAKADLTGGTITEGQFKTSMNDLIDFLSESIGTTGGRVETTNAGTASTPSIANAGDTNTGIFWPSADTLGVATGGSQRVTVDGSGKVGIGTSSPSTQIEMASLAPTIRLTDTGDNSYSQLAWDLGQLFISADRSNTQADSAIKFNIDNAFVAAFTEAGRLGIGVGLPQAPLDLGDGTGEKIRLYGSGTVGDNYSLGVEGEELRFNSAKKFVFAQGESYPGTEIARLNDKGSLLVGTTSDFPDEATPGIALRSGNDLRAFNGNDGTSVAHALGGSAGSVLIQGDGDLLNTNGNYGTISDPRLKQDVSPVSSQWDDVKELGSRFVNYRLKDSVERQGDDAPTLLSVLADDDFAARFPGLTKTDAETGYRSFKQSVASMKALVALSEALERIEALEARLG